MSDDSDRKSEPDARVLRVMVRAVSEEPMPELRWDRLEERLFLEIEGGAARAPARLELPASAAVGAPAARVDLAEAADPTEGVRPSMIPGALLATPADRGAGSAAAGPTWRRAAVRAFAALAVAAGLGGLFVASDHRRDDARPIAVVGEPVDVAALPRAQGMPGGVLDATALEMGDVVEAAIGPLSFGHGDLGVSWTLSAGGRVVVRETAGSGAHVVELESGSLRGQVVGPSALVVRAGETDVATVAGAAGAVFTVTRSSRGLVVHVESGAATVGERSHFLAAAGRQGARLLGAPVRASVALDGSRNVEIIPDEVASWSSPPAEEPPRGVHEELALPVAAESPVRAQVSPAQPASAHGRPGLGGEAPGAPADARPVMSVGAIGGALARCFADVRASGKAPSEVSVTVRSTLTIKVAEDGAVKAVSFNPPLRPDLQGCAVFLFKERLGEGARTISVPVELK